MKASVLICFISLIIYYVESFEYHEEYNAEDEGRSLDYYRELPTEEMSPYGPVLTAISSRDTVPNEIPDEANVNIPENPHVATEFPEVTTKRETKKPYYEEKDAPELFQKFITDFNKQYKDEEEYNKRYQNFINNLKVINQLNKDQEATFDINMFSDLGEGESVIG